MTSVIAVSGLRKSFGRKAVLVGIDLEVGAGTTFSLLGPNGAGKTTTVPIMPRWSARTAARCGWQATTWPGTRRRCGG